MVDTISRETNKQTTESTKENKQIKESNNSPANKEGGPLIKTTRIDLPNTLE